MTFFRMKSTFLIGLMMIIILSSLGNAFSGMFMVSCSYNIIGIVVAKLPFQPFFLISGLTHRGLLGNDYTDASYLCIYILTSFILR